MTEPVVFDAGGKSFKVAKSTILKHPDTMLARMISEDWFPSAGAIPSSQTGPSMLFVDCSPELFASVVEWYRFGVLQFPRGGSKHAANFCSIATA
eukprot:1471604-Rhodomonas_salina.7